MADFWAKVDVMRAWHAVSRDELAAAIGKHGSQVSRMKAGSEATSLDVVEALCEALPGLSVEVGVDLTVDRANRQYHRPDTAPDQAESHVA